MFKYFMKAKSTDDLEWSDIMMITSFLKQLGHVVAQWSPAHQLVDIKMFSGG